MLELRHLVVTVVSVFIALVLGILIGVGLSQPPRLQELTEGIQRQIQSIQRDIDAKRQEITQAHEDRKALESILERERKALKLALPTIVSGELTNHRTLLVQTSCLDDFSFKDSLVQAIQKAGGAIAATVMIRSALVDLEGDELQAVLTALEVGEIAPEQAVPKICRQLTKLLLQGDPEGRLRTLVEAGVVELSVAGDPAQPVDSLVVVGGSDDEDRDDSELIDLPIIAVCQELGKRCVATEPEKILVSFMGPYQTAEVTTVDNVDQLLGQISLVYALAGAEGQFGVKETATEILPTAALEAAAGSS